jgi:predicted ABC-type exoprotein transport system permease subunit
MIKVVNMVSLIVAPIIVKYTSGSTNWWVIAIAVVLFIGVAWAIMQSKKEAPLTGAALPEFAQPVTSAPAKQTPPPAANTNKNQNNQQKKK